MPDASVEIIETSIQANSDRSDTFDPVAIFDHVAGRRLFVKALNKARGKRQNITRQFDRFTIIMRRFLDACLAHHDVEGAKMIMILVRPHSDSQTDFHLIFACFVRVMFAY